MSGGDSKPCTLKHAQRAMRAGITREELVEAVAVAASCAGSAFNTVILKEQHALNSPL
ncbi:MAG: carboxymuconolactone decarboxylase family protein [Methanobacteriaceae archaeon]|nr:carboxymuconolactone decarboxylase family protein [Methanobacteriaceae archaeon]